ncbi:7TM diverse intracellular signaling domain-containing protein [Flammeovirga sp. SubArs3]|uniref:sensor histidine kinase n=1 Tax=Flammeovirga sp. SubArs3 TaxID=2995316 RepID=UPI00248C17F5|nr:7TM diverse intracellular signaling domain-containing protein [Flammeovirga sp. SubArs3]
MRKILHVFLLIFFLLKYQSIPAKTILVDTAKTTVNCTNAVDIYQDKVPLFIDNDPFFLDEWNDVPLDGLSEGPFSKGNWHRLILESEVDVQKLMYFNYVLIPNIHIWVKEEGNNSIEYFSFGTNSDYYTTEQSRDYRGYVVPLSFKANKIKEIYFFMEGHGWPTHSDIYLYDPGVYRNNFERDNYVLTILRVVVLTMLTIGLVIGIISRQNVFLYYALSFYSGVLFAEVELGIFVRFLDVNYHHLSYYIRHFANIAYITSLLYFYKYLIGNDNSSFNAVLKWFAPFIHIYSVVTFLLFLFSDNPTMIAIIFLSIVVVSWLSFLICFVLLLRSVRKNNIYAKYAFFVLVSRLIVIAIFVSLPHLGLIERSIYTDYLYYLFIGYESVFYFIMLMKKVINIYDERIELLSKQKQLEKAYSEAVLKGQEDERNRIGRELHDYVGGNLALVNKSDHLDGEEVKSIITSTIKTVREMSHGLITPTFNDVQNFEDAIFDLSSKYNSDDMSVFIKFVDWPDSNKKELLNHCYRVVQELLYNAEKHSEANSVHIQFFSDNNIGRIFYEDNGIGFNVNASKNGVGLANIRYRSNAMGGKSIIESSSYGTVIRIEDIHLD